MTDMEQIKQLVELQDLFNRQSEINNLYNEQETKLQRIHKDNEALSNTISDIGVNIREMEKKINEELGKRDEINKRIASLEDGKDKIKIARQLKSWEKEMEKMQQELSLIQAQIDYDTSKDTELKNEQTRIQDRINENSGSAENLQGEIDNIKSSHKDELADIEGRIVGIKSQFEVAFIDYFYRMLGKTRGNAIVIVEGDACSGCNIVLPTELQGDLGPELPSEEYNIVQCPHCFRYLYYREWLER